MKQLMTILFIMFSMIACNGEVSENKEKGAGYFVTKDPHFIDTLQIDKLIESLPEKYTKQIIFKANWGHGEGEYWEAGDSPKVGPGNVYVDEKGQIYIWDVGNKRIAVYNKTGELIKYYNSLNFGSWSRMYIDKDTLFAGEFIIDINSEEITKIPWEVARNHFTSLSGRGHNNTSWFYDLIDKIGKAELENYSINLERKKNSEILKQKKEKWIGYQLIDCDKAGNIFLLGNFTIEGEGKATDTKSVIYKYSPSYKLLSIIDINEASWNVLWGEPRILNYFIDENGDIYALIPAIEGEGKGLDGKTGIILIKYSLTK